MRNPTVPVFCDVAPGGADFRDAILSGLARKPKNIPCRFLYDARGSALFDAICDVPEYYLTRTETAILEARAQELAALLGRGIQLVEFGSGASRKTRLILGALSHPQAYVAIDISREMLNHASAEIAARFPDLAVTAICADFMHPEALPPLPPVGTGRRLGFFPGSTIGNLEPEEAVAFLAACRHVLGGGGLMLVGIDLKKDKAILDRAYNDAAGLTAAFNLNLLERINRELGADFMLKRFAHSAAYNEAAGRIEIHIKSLVDQVVAVAGRAVSFAAGERIHTEHSYKYDRMQFERLARRAGFRPVRDWTDEKSLFGVVLLSA